MLPKYIDKNDKILIKIVHYGMFPFNFQSKINSTKTLTKQAKKPNKFKETWNLLDN